MVSPYTRRTEEYTKLETETFYTLAEILEALTKILHFLFTSILQKFSISFSRVFYKNTGFHFHKNFTKITSIRQDAHSNIEQKCDLKQILNKTNANLHTIF